MEAGALRAPVALNRISVTAPLLRLRSDEQLVALFRAGNDAAFSVIHDRYRQRLFAYSRQMLGGSRQDAEDALQDVFMRAYSSLRSNDRPLSLRAWLYRVAHNRCIDQLRRPTPPAADLFDTSRKPLLDPMDEAERREDLRQLVADVRRLPDQQRSALLMREMDGMSYAELASALGISLQAVKSLLVRARIGLVEAVEARDTACSQIRLDLTDAFDRGVRASGLARRHLRDCEGCVEYRAQLRGVRQGLGMLAPGVGPWTTILKLVGLGGAGSAGAASAGGGAAAGTGVLAAAGTGTAAKVAAVVCCAALTAGGAVEVRDQIAGTARAPAAAKKRAAPAAHSAASARPAAVASVGAVAGSGASKTAAHKLTRADARGTQSTAGRHIEVLPGEGGASVPATDPAAVTPEEPDFGTGGASAPHEDTGFAADGLTPRKDPATSTAPATGSTAPATTSGGTLGGSKATSGTQVDSTATSVGAATASGSAATG
jgi:RNA polymerase sigma factor (sigma-70 family)